MNEGRKPYIAGNWKMNLDRSRALDLIKTIKGRLGDGTDREVAVFTPSVYLADVSAVAQGSPLGIGAQNMWYERSGAFTGELSGEMLREVGADRVLPVLGVGESLDERRRNRTERVVKKQLEAGLGSIRPEEARRLTIAYEPVWAIGTGETATPDQAADVHTFIRKWVHQRLGAEASQAMRILYGGSVKPDNVKALMAVDDIDGVLVGGASLKADTFLPIIEFES